MLQIQIKLKNRLNYELVYLEYQKLKIKNYGFL